MESFEPVWVFGAIILIAGVLLGGLISRKLNPSATEIDELRAKLDRSRNEMEQYRASVNGHFNKTSDLVKELTEDYVKVYRHLAQGAQTLSDAPEFSHLLEQQKGKVLISSDDEPDSRDIADTRTAPVSAPDLGAAEAISSVEDESTDDDAGAESAGEVDEAVPLDSSGDDRSKVSAAAAAGDRIDPAARTDTH